MDRAAVDAVKVREHSKCRPRDSAVALTIQSNSGENYESSHIRCSGGDLIVGGWRCRTNGGKSGGRRQGFGRLRNLALGLAGALVGGLIFNLFRLLPELDRIAISLRDIVAAMSGSALVLVAVWLGRKSREADEP